MINNNKYTILNNKIDYEIIEFYDLIFNKRGWEN